MEDLLDNVSIHVEGTCPSEFEVCYTEEEWEALSELLYANDLYGTYEETLELAPVGDAEAVTTFAWELLFLSPW